MLERMYTVNIATASCQNFHHEKNVPVLIHIGYNDNKHHHRYKQTILKESFPESFPIIFGK